jgi:hypothetical protein
MSNSPHSGSRSQWARCGSFVSTSSLTSSLQPPPPAPSPAAIPQECRTLGVRVNSELLKINVGTCVRVCGFMRTATQMRCTDGGVVDFVKGPGDVVAGMTDDSHVGTYCEVLCKVSSPTELCNIKCVHDFGDELDEEAWNEMIKVMTALAAQEVDAPRPPRVG